MGSGVISSLIMKGSPFIFMKSFFPFSISSYNPSLRQILSVKIELQVLGLLTFGVKLDPNLAQFGAFIYEINISLK